MVTKQEFDAAIAAINEATSQSAGEVERIAGEVETLKGKIITSGMNSADEASVLASINAISESANALAIGLKGIAGADPVPDPLPDTETPAV